MTNNNDTELVSVRFTSATESFVGVDGRTYPETMPGDIASIPKENAAVFKEKGVLVIMEPEPIPEPVIISSVQQPPYKIWSDEGELTYLGNLPMAEFVRPNAKGERSPNIVGFAKYIKNKFSPVTFNATIYIFDKMLGIYKEDAGEVDRTIELLLEKIEWDGTAINTRKEVRVHVLTSNMYAKYPFNYRTDLVPFSNCCGHYNPVPGTWSNTAHDRGYLFTYQIPTEFIPGLDTSLVDAVFADWVGEERKSVLYEAPAVGIIQAVLKTPFKKAFLFKGERDSGKSTYLDLISKTIGDANISRVSLQRIGARFALASIENKLLNIFDDLPGLDMRDINSFKNLTGSCFHEIERKQVQGYNGTLTAAHIFTCNQPPALDMIDDEAWWSRWQYEMFSGTFSRDQTYQERTFTPDFIRCFVSGIMREAGNLLKNKKLKHERDIPDVKEMWCYATDPQYRFVNDSFNKNPDAWNETQTILTEYKKWCALKMITPSSDQKFYKKLEGFGFIVEKRNKKHGYKGFELKPAATTTESKEGVGIASEGDIG